MHSMLPIRPALQLPSASTPTLLTAVWTLYVACCVRSAVLLRFRDSAPTHRPQECVLAHKVFQVLVEQCLTRDHHPAVCHVHVCPRSICQAARPQQRHGWRWRSNVKAYQHKSLQLQLQACRGTDSTQQLLCIRALGNKQGCRVIYPWLTQLQYGCQPLCLHACYQE